MSGNPKFAILEKDGVELGYTQEYIPESEDILYEAGSQLSVKDYLKYPFSAFIPRDIVEAILIPSRISLPMHSPVLTKELYIDGEAYIL